VDELSSALHALKPAPRIGCYMWGVQELKGTRDWKTWAEHGDIDLFSLTGYYYEKNYGKDYLQRYEESFRNMAAVLEEVQRPIDFTVCVGIATSHGRIEKAEEVDAYLEIAKRAGVDGAAIFTWHTLRPYLGEVKERKYFEIFEAGQIDNALRLVKQFGPAGPLLHWDFVLGVPGSMTGEPRNLMFLVDRIPAASTWTCTGIGRWHMPVTMTALALGGNVRLGFEDNIFLHKGVLAQENAELVGRVARIAQEWDRPCATPDEARQILKLGERAES
jgi:3-keto-5-aminohexanoate cleavage enzyme